MSLMHDFNNHPATRTESVPYVVPFRIIEACDVRGISTEYLAGQLAMELWEMNLIMNGYKSFPEHLEPSLCSLLDFPFQFFKRIRWKQF